jgi:hypothetical protein
MPLKTKQVGKYTVSQVGTLESARMRVFTDEKERYLAVLKKDGKEIPDELLLTLEEWVSFAACIMPKITIEEYLQTPIVELTSLGDALQEVNDNGLPVTVPSKKKKSSKAEKSMPA